MGMDVFAYLWFGSTPKIRNLSYAEVKELNTRLEPKGLMIVHITSPGEDLAAMAITATYRRHDWDDKPERFDMVVPEPAAIEAFKSEVRSFDPDFQDDDLGWYQGSTYWS